MAFPVFLDTCALFGQTLCDLLLSLAEQGCFAPYWSTEVLDALERNVVVKGHAPAESIRRRRLNMESAFPEAVVDGFSLLTDRMTNHPGDRHVLAACVVSPAHTIVTFNVKDFPAESLDPYEIDVVHPDDFLLDQFDLHPVWSDDAVERLLARRRRPPKDVAGLADELRRSDCPRAADALLDRLG